MKVLQDKNGKKKTLELKILLDQTENGKSHEAWEKLQKGSTDKRIQFKALQVSMLKELEKKGAVIRCVSPDDAGKSHNKVMIIDEKTVLTGSFNYKKHEIAQIDNLVILEYAGVAKNYRKMFEVYFRASVPM